MSEIELKLIKEAKNCTLYTIQFTVEDDAEFEKFYKKFKGNLQYNDDFERILNVINMIIKRGAYERFFRPEGKMKDRVCALPVLQSKLRLYCLRLSDKILILGNGGVKKSQKYQEDNELQGYVLTLQKFDELIREGERSGSIVVSENILVTEKTYKL